MSTPTAIPVARPAAQAAERITADQAMATVAGQTEPGIVSGTARNTTCRTILHTALAAARRASRRAIPRA